MNNLSTIKTRLLIALSCLSILVVFSASLGLMTFSKLETQINTITDQAAPTIEEADDLIAVLWKSAKVANEILASEDKQEIATLSQELNVLSSEFTETSQRLVEYVNDSEHLALIEKAKQEHKEFVNHYEKMVDAHNQELDEEEKAKQLLDEFDKNGARLISALDEFAIKNEEEMRKAEQRGDELVSTGGSARQINSILSELFEKDYPVVEASLKLQRLVIELQDTSGEYLAEENPANLPTIKREFDNLASQSDQYFIILSTLAETQEDKQDADTLITAFNEWIELANTDEQLFDSYRDQLAMEYKADELTELLESDVDNANSALDEVATAADTFMDNADDAAAETVESATFMQSSIVLIAVVGGGLMTLLFMKVIISPINTLLNDIQSKENDLTHRADESANNEVGALARIFNGFVEKIQSIIIKIANSSHRLLEASKTMNQLLESVTTSIRQQNSETDSTAAAINELSASVADISTNLDNVSGYTSAANQEGKQAKDFVDSTVDAVQALADDIKRNSTVIESLNQESNNIGDVLNVIQGIAEQTNLLALNAAIEAARAGEQGRGFAVVADEVRTLAARTQNSTEEIQKMIDRLQQGVHKAVESMHASQTNSEKTVSQAQEAGKILDDISNSISNIDGKVLEINVAVQQQSEVTESINKSVCNIVESSQGIISAVGDVRDQSKSVFDLGEEMAELVNQFKFKQKLRLQQL
jgi:methyl-accepting chemotaxis protein